MSAFSVAVTAWSLTTLVLSANQPNILFLMCDSMDGRNMDPTAGQYPLMNMPNLRALVEKGSVMTKHYASSPQCVPGRTTLFSGRRIDQSGGYNNGMGWGMTSDGATTDPNCKNDYNEATCKRFGNMQKFNLTLFDAMRAIGYDVYLYGKVDVGAGVIEKGNAHYDNQTNATADGFHNGPNPGSGITIETRSANIQKPTKGRPKADETDNNVKHNDFVIAANCVDRLNEIKKSKSTKPWFMYCSINIPHPPYQTNATWLASVNSKAIPIPPWIPESEFHPADKYMSISKQVWGNFSDEDILSVRQTYYAMNVETDYLLGTVLNASYQNGWNASNTIIVFTSDHGDMNMEHRQWLKNSMYEGSSRIPLFFAGPGIKEKNVIHNATATIDVLPTLIEIGGGKPDPSISGYSLIDMLFKNKNVEDTEHPDYITSQYHSNMGNTGSFMVRKDQWKYIQFGHYLKAFKDYKPQLFDLEKDINEINDVSTSNLDVVQQLEAILSNEFNYEYVDCIAKQNDFLLFEEFQWNKYNESTMKSRMKEAYDGFDDNDWEILVDWRNELLNTTNTTCEEHAAEWLRPTRDEERIQLY